MKIHESDSQTDVNRRSFLMAASGALFAPSLAHGKIDDHEPFYTFLGVPGIAFHDGTGRIRFNFNLPYDEATYLFKNDFDGQMLANSAQFELYAPITLLVMPPIHPKYNNGMVGWEIWLKPKGWGKLDRKPRHTIDFSEIFDVLRDKPNIHVV
jgi:hypothetical protein